MEDFRNNRGQQSEQTYLQNFNYFTNFTLNIVEPD